MRRSGTCHPRYRHSRHRTHCHPPVHTCTRRQHMSPSRRNMATEVCRIPAMHTGHMPGSSRMAHPDTRTRKRRPSKLRRHCTHARHPPRCTRRAAARRTPLAWSDNRRPSTRHPSMHPPARTRCPGSRLCTCRSRNFRTAHGWCRGTSRSCIRPCMTMSTFHSNRFARWDIDPLAPTRSSRCYRGRRIVIVRCRHTSRRRRRTRRGRLQRMRRSSTFRYRRNESAYSSRGTHPSRAGHRPTPPLLHRTASRRRRIRRRSRCGIVPASNTVSRASTH